MPPRPALSGHSIPHLLSSLPTSSASSIASSSSSRIHKPIFIRPASAPSTSFYAITRSKLKFTQSDAVARVSTARHPSKIVGEAKAANLPNPAPVKDGRVGGEARVRVSGRAWGRQYRDGKLVLPTSPRAKPDGKIHGAAKRKWVLVDPSTVPEGVIEELNQAIAADREAAIASASS